VTVGLTAWALAAIRRKYDPLLIYFCFFAVLYGMRLRIQTGLLQLTVPGSPFDPRLRTAVNYLVVRPAFLFMNATGLMTRIGRIPGYALVVFGTVLSAGNFWLRTHPVV
jgi:sigma-B regulation protein RsbU (phosphoserine phosphatase)